MDDEVGGRRSGVTKDLAETTFLLNDLQRKDARESSHVLPNMIDIAWRASFAILSIDWFGETNILAQDCKLEFPFRSF